VAFKSIGKRREAIHSSLWNTFSLRPMLGRIFEIFSPKNRRKNWRFWLKTMLTSSKIGSWHWFFLKNSNFFRRKLAKVEENSSRNIDPWSDLSKVTFQYPPGHQSQTTIWSISSSCACRYICAYVFNFASQKSSFSSLKKNIKASFEKATLKEAYETWNGASKKGLSTSVRFQELNDD
jgi:hypothetical protein